ncbi:MAG: succinate--CoA ligase subunit beta, partial [Candidatus Bathyarchaeia archaeon]
MRLLEFQGKNIFRNYGIPVPQGFVAQTLKETEQNLNIIDLSFPIVLKAQVPVGGRGKAGGVQKAVNVPEALVAAEKLFNSRIGNYPVHLILVEEMRTVVRELYLAVAVDTQEKAPLLLASPMGGIDIEMQARQHPDAVIKKPLPIGQEIPNYILRFLRKKINLEDVLFEDLQRVIRRMLHIFYDHDAVLVEINPLAVTPQGLCALDAKVILDDAAWERHQVEWEIIKREQTLAHGERGEDELLADASGLTYVRLSGNIGIISDGAGTGMLTLDLIKEFGGAPACFCDLGGLAGPETMKKALAVMHANPDVKVVLISLIGGLTRMDAMAEGIVEFVKERGIFKPFVVRMYGTKADIGQELLAQVGVKAYADLEIAIKNAIALSKEEEWPF